jgi:hypothetical protein
MREARGEVAIGPSEMAIAPGGFRGQTHGLVVLAQPVACGCPMPMPHKPRLEVGGGWGGGGEGLIGGGGLQNAPCLPHTPRLSALALQIPPTSGGRCFVGRCGRPI